MGYVYVNASRWRPHTSLRLPEWNREKQKKKEERRGEERKNKIK